MASIYHHEEGSGQTVILIHGFPMNHHVWDRFAAELGKTYHVVAPDLPGFGKSHALSEGFSLENVASALWSWITENGWTRPVLIGHSLGGYVSLAMAEQHPDRISGLCLFHSTALADSQEKKESRNKVLDFIGTQGVEAFTSNFIGQLYADPRHESIRQVKNIAVQSSAEAVKGYTRAMRDRKDRTDVLKRFARPILLLAGEKDAGIPPESIHRQASLNPRAEADIISSIAHMGMFEAEATCLKKIQNFLEKAVVTF